MGILPAQSVGTTMPAELAPAVQCAIAPGLLDALWRTCEAEACGLTRAGFEQILLRIGMAHNFGLASGAPTEATAAQQSALFSSLRLEDLVLARACGQGIERAWERFLALYREPLLRAGIAITRSESLGRELADGLYAELYGLTVRDGERRCPLDSYCGRGSLLGWLRTTLAQRHIDRHRRTHREQPLDETSDCSTPAPEASAGPDQQSLPLVAAAVREVLDQQEPEDRFLLASYYLDGRKLHEIAAVLGVHEATVSRKLKRVTENIRKHIVRNLEHKGMSRREAQEALQTDPRDLTRPEPSAQRHFSSEYLKIKELLQTSEPRPFKDQAGATGTS